MPSARFVSRILAMRPQDKHSSSTRPVQWGREDMQDVEGTRKSLMLHPLFYPPICPSQFTPSGPRSSFGCSFPSPCTCLSPRRETRPVPFTQRPTQSTIAAGRLPSERWGLDKHQFNTSRWWSLQNIGPLGSPSKSRF